MPIPAWLLLLLYWARRTKIITPFEYRVWWEAAEISQSVRARYGRRDIPNGAHVAQSEEVAKRLGLSKSRQAARSLASLQLLHWTTNLLALPESLSSVNVPSIADFNAFSSDVGPAAETKTPIPFPRRVGRILAGGVGISQAATLTAVAIRCLRRRRIAGRPTTISGGLVSTEWLTQAFRVSRTAVKSALAEFQSVGLIHRLQTPPRIRQSHGTRTVVDLLWKTRGKLISARPENDPLQANFELKNDPPQLYSFNKDPFPSGRIKHQDRRPAGRRDGLSRAKSGMARVTCHDLRDTERLLALFADATRLGIMTASEFDWYRFVCAAERALARGKSPERFFAKFVRDGLWDYLDSTDEDRATKRLAEHRQSSLAVVGE